MLREVARDRFIRRSWRHAAASAIVVGALVSLAGAGPQVPDTRPQSARPAGEAGDDPEVELRGDLVLVPVAARRDDGGVVEDLKAAELSIFEDGAGQQIAFFNRDTAPLDAVLLLDTSGSIAASLEVIQSAALAFARQLRPDDRISLVTFADHPRIVLDWTADVGAVGAALRSVEPTGDTALYGSVVASVYERFSERPEGRRRAVVVLTDGDDTISSVTSRTAAEAAMRHEASVYVVSVGRLLRDMCEQLSNNSGVPPAERARYRATAGRLKRAEERVDYLASQTGGRVLYPRRIGDLSKAYGQVADEIRSRYLVGYYPPAGAPSGFRAISVSTRRKGVQLHARQGYFRD